MNGLLRKDNLTRNDEIDYSAISSRDPGQENVLFLVIREPFESVGMALIGSNNTLVLDLVREDGSKKRVALRDMSDNQIRVIRLGGAMLVLMGTVDGQISPIRECKVAL